MKFFRTKVKRENDDKTDFAIHAITVRMNPVVLEARFWPLSGTRCPSVLRQFHWTFSLPSNEHVFSRRVVVVASLVERLFSKN